MLQIATTIEQSNKLIELGIDINTADMYRVNYENKTYLTSMDDEFDKHTDTYAWSLSALLELMPKTMKGIPEKAAYCLILKENSYNAWKCNYEHFSFGELYEIPAQPTPINATFEMMCYLLENKLI